MPETSLPNLSSVAETLLIPLCVRAGESQRSDAILHDEIAEAVVRRMGCDTVHILAHISPQTRVAVVLRSRQLDRMVSEFLRRCPQGVVVHIGCGLDTRFERVDNGQVEWYDLDLPEVMELRRRILGDEPPRYHLLAQSVLDFGWLDTVGIHSPRPFLFLAESVLMYLEELQVRSLVLALQERFPGSELVFDAFSPFFLWANNLRVSRTKVGVPGHWALKRGQDLETWHDGIHLLDEWFPFMQPEPRLAGRRLVSHIPLLAKTTGIFHYRLD